MQITVEIPEDFAAHISNQREELSRRLVEDAAVGAYCRDAISRFELQSILGLSSYEVDGFLKRNGIEHGAYSGQDLIEDVAALEADRA